MDKNMTISPKISLIMSNYNKGRYIGEAISSVINQAYQDWELLILDDGSQDNSINVIRSFEDVRITLFKNEVNRGVVEGRKKLINITSSNIIGIIDSDDYLCKDAVGIMVEAHSLNPEKGLIYSQFMYSDENLNEIKKGFCDHIPINESNLSSSSVSHFCTFKKDVYYKTSLYDERLLYCEDMDIIYKLEEVAPLLFIDKVLYRHRMLPDSQSNAPIKTDIAKISHNLSRYDAYKRRINTSLPSISKKEMSEHLLNSLPLCIKIKDKRRFAYYLIESIKTYPINLSGYYSLVKRVLKYLTK